MENKQKKQKINYYFEKRFPIEKRKREEEIFFYVDCDDVYDNKIWIEKFENLRVLSINCGKIEEIYFDQVSSSNIEKFKLNNLNLNNLNFLSYFSRPEKLQKLTISTSEIKFNKLKIKEIIHKFKNLRTLNISSKFSSFYVDNEIKTLSNETHKTFFSRTKEKYFHESKIVYDKEKETNYVEIIHDSFHKLHEKRQKEQNKKIENVVNDRQNSLKKEEENEKNFSKIIHSNKNIRKYSVFLTFFFLLSNFIFIFCFLLRKNKNVIKEKDI